MVFPQNDGSELDLSDLDVERFNVIDDTDIGVERLSLWSIGHGMTEIGASCCSSGTHTNGSCTAAEA
ncbi:MAG: hypothetical protein OHK0022_03640 [Roseiflexaceae bacterium]